MRLILLSTLFYWCCIAAACAQSTAGITNITDTSYSTQSAYEYTRKEHPEISVVKEFKYTDVGEQRNIVYCKTGDKALLTDVFFPKGKSIKKRTAIIIVHGGGWRSGNRTQHYPLAQSLAHLGYVCFTPAYRLSTEALYPAGVYDIKAAIRWTKSIASTYNLDTAKIVIAGFSAGGELATFMATTGNNPAFAGQDCANSTGTAVAALIDIDGTLSFVHPESGEGNDTKGTSAATYWFGYPKKDNPGLWAQASPLTHVSAHTPPTLFINSAAERMHAGRTDYIDTLTKYKIYTEVKTFEGAPHSFCLFHPWFTPTVSVINEFLKKTLR